jgi:hypothetical protein
MPDNTILLDFGQRSPAWLFDAYLRSLSNSQWYNGTAAPEDFVLANWTNYAVPLVEVGGSGATGLFIFTVPPVLAIDSWDFLVRQRAGANPAVSDPPVAASAFGWDGTKIIEPVEGAGGAFAGMVIQPAPPSWAQPSDVTGPWVFHEGDQWPPISEALNLPGMPDLSGCQSSFVMTEETCTDEVLNSPNVTITLPTTCTFQQTNEFVNRGVYNYGWNVTRGDGKKFFATAGANRQIVILPKL